MQSDVAFLWYHHVFAWTDSMLWARLAFIRLSRDCVRIEAYWTNFTSPLLCESLSMDTLSCCELHHYWFDEECLLITVRGEIEDGERKVILRLWTLIDS